MVWASSRIDVVELDVRQRRRIAPQRAVRDQHQIALADVMHAVGASGAREIEDAQMRCEARRFLLPVEQHRPRHDDERRRRGQTARLALVSACVEQREHDDGLAEAHVVGQASAEAEFAQERQPTQSFALIGAQRSDEGLGRIHRLDVLERAQTLARGLRRGVPRYGGSSRQHGIEQRHLRTLEADVIALASANRQRREIAQPGLRQNAVGAVSEHDGALLRFDCLEQLRQRHRLIVERGLAPQLEPVHA